MNRWFLPAFSAALTLVLAIATGVAALDPSLAHYARPAEIVVLVVGPLLIIVTVFLNRPSPPRPLPFDHDAFDNLRNTVEEAKSITHLDPGLENEDDWADKLGRWKDTAKSLKAMTGDEKDGVLEIANKEPARELLELTVAIVRALLQRGWKKELVELVPPAYSVAVKLQRWDDAGMLAHGLAYAYYDLGRIEDAERWTNLMAKNKEQIDQKIPKTTELQLRYLELKGLLAGKHHNIVDEKHYFDQALDIAEKLKLSASGTAQVRLTGMTATLQMRLAELVEASDLDQAVNLYKELLNSTIDPEVQVRCYERLGTIALASREYDDAYGYYERQLSVSAKSGLQAQSMAWEGMGKVLSKKTLSRQDYPSDKEYEDAKKALLATAYRKFRKALELEEEVAPDSARAHRLQIEIIKLTDKMLPENTAQI